jgi:Fe-S-cluster containining protein
MRSSENENGPPVEADLPGLVARCQADAAMLAGLRRIYEELEGAMVCLPSGAPVCLGGGSCCRFDLSGHRLYLTVGELALLTLCPPPDLDRARLRRCPYQIGGRCGAYTRRPLGCRTFFCRNPQKFSLQDLHQQFHRAIAELHQSRCTPYAYAELSGTILQLFVDK